MEEITVAIADHLIWVILGACVVLISLIKAATIAFTTHARERSRREIAAYVAEGSISSDQGERLMIARIGDRPMDAV